VFLLRGGDGDRANAASLGFLRRRAGAHGHSGGALNVNDTPLSRRLEFSARQAEGAACPESGHLGLIKARIGHRRPQWLAWSRHWLRSLPEKPQSGLLPKYIFSRGPERDSGTGLVQQTVQIVASHDLTLFVMRSATGGGYCIYQPMRGALLTMWRVILSDSSSRCVDRSPR